MVDGDRCCGRKENRKWRVQRRKFEYFIMVLEEMRTGFPGKGKKRYKGTALGHAVGLSYSRDSNGACVAGV